jgi:signal transduction histidine kinase
MHLRGLLRRYGDVLLAMALAAVFTGEVLVWDNAELPVAALLAAAGPLALAWRRTAPLLAFLVCSAGSIAAIRLAPGIDNDSVGFILVFFISLYSVGRWTRGAGAWFGGLCVFAYAVAFFIADAQLNSEPIGPGDVGFAILFVGTPWAAGVAIRVRRDREQTLLEESERAIAQERARIARELHDVVSHAISVSVLQARGGRAMVGRDQDAVRHALDAIEQTNTAALSDMRRLLAVLRDTETDEARMAPQPSLANLERLIDQARAAGLTIELELQGEAGPVPPGVDLSAYRIIQEALTNVMKHAGPTSKARVLVAYSDDDLRVTVSDDGTGRTERNRGGHGLAGIRERVAVVGGTVEAGPRPEGGFVVNARLPYALEPSS